MRDFFCFVLFCFFLCFGTWTPTTTICMTPVLKRLCFVLWKGHQIKCFHCEGGSWSNFSDSMCGSGSPSCPPTSLHHTHTHTHTHMHTHWTSLLASPVTGADMSISIRSSTSSLLCLPFFCFVLRSEWQIAAAAEVTLICGEHNHTSSHWQDPELHCTPSTEQLRAPVWEEELDRRLPPGPPRNSAAYWSAWALTSSRSWLGVLFFFFLQMYPDCNSRVDSSPGPAPEPTSPKMHLWAEAERCRGPSRTTRRT